MRRLGYRRIAALAAIGATGLAVLGGTVAAGSGDDGDNSQHLRSQIRSKKPKNVILLLGDGMGSSEITLARYYAKGAGGGLNLDALPFSGNYTTYSRKPGAGPSYLPDYVPDSAATGTAWATGKKTIDDRISQGPSSALDVPGSNSGFDTVLERAKQAGKRVGNVSTGRRPRRLAAGRGLDVGAVLAHPAATRGVHSRATEG